MSFNQWMLAFHVLAAFSLVAGSTLFWVLVVAIRRIDTPDDTLRLGPVVKVGNATIGIGMGGTIILGIYLAFALDGYAIWDGWILAALVLWVIGAALGRQVEEAYRQGPRKALELKGAGENGPNAELLALNRTSRGVLLHALTGRPALDHHRHDLEAGRMSVLATVRPDDWNFPLFLHVLGAMILVAGLVTGAAALFFARGDAKLLRLGFWSLMLVSFPGWVLMRLGAQWIYSKEGWDKVPDNLRPDWLGIGTAIADAGGLVLVITLIIGGIGVRRLDAGNSSALLKATLVLSVVLLAAYIVAVWAMAGKPG